MIFKKLNEHLMEALPRLGFGEALPFQQKFMPKFKSGMNIYGIGNDGIGKTTSLIIATIQKLKSEAFEDAPRAIILVKDKTVALELEEAFKPFIRRTDLRICAVYEDRKINDQIDMIYIGMDIVIATPKQLSKIYFLNGINLSQIQLFAIDDAEFLQNENSNTEINRLVDSIPKSQYLVFANKMVNKISKFEEGFMERSIQISE